jgi:glyoxylase-like metal-dependent hydrolase (beta-lactamase superfamily II)
VIITHAHADHYSGATFVDREGRYVPTFPRARYYLGRRDWEEPKIQAGLQDPDSIQGRTLGVLHRLGILELVDDRRELLPTVSIIPAPGETAGHQIVRIFSSGEAFYCLGDLYHFEEEVEHPDWMPAWGDRGQEPATRKIIAEMVAAEDANVAPAHVPVGRLRRTPSGFKWTGA